jgi:hypothetical protein
MRRLRRSAAANPQAAHLHRARPDPDQGRGRLPDLAGSARRPAQQDKAGTPITLDAVAKQARVSRSWLDNQPDLRAEVERLRARRNPVTTGQPVPDRQRASDTSLLRRLESAAKRIGRLEAENRQLREALALALGERRAATVLGGTHDTWERNPSRSSDPANGHVDDTVPVRSPLVKAMIVSPAQDNGRKRFIVTDTLGLLIVVVVMAASGQDRDGAKATLLSAYLVSPVRFVLADGGFAGKLVAWAATILRTTLHIVRKPKDQQGFGKSMPTYRRPAYSASTRGVSFVVNCEYSERRSATHEQRRPRSFHRIRPPSAAQDHAFGRGRQA